MVSSKKAKILVVDDVARNLSVIEAILTPHGYEVVVAHNGLEAVEIARNQRPDLILLDILMPDMDGFTACSKIKSDENTKTIPIVIVTAVAHEQNKEFTKELGADGFVAKPFMVQDLLNVIDEYLHASQNS